MLTTLVFTAFAATTARASFQEWVWGSGPEQATLTGSAYGNTVVAALEGYAEDPNARKWEIANGQLRSGSGQCAYPAIGEWLRPALLAWSYQGSNARPQLGRRGQPPTQQQAIRRQHPAAALPERPAQQVVRRR